MLPPLLPRAPHGGPSSAPFTGLDFSVNTNPYGPNRLLLEAVRQADHAHYPDPSYLALRQALADWHGVSPDRVAPSVGASDLLHRIARAFLPPGGQLLSLYAPFGELERAAKLQRANVIILEQLPEVLPPGTRLFYVGQPHNPTGRSLSGNELHALAEACAAVGALLIVDLAYSPFVEVPVIQHPAAINLFSPGKAHGLVGARPAYALASHHVIARLENLAPAWHLPAGTAALLQLLPRAQGFLSQTLPTVRQDAENLAATISQFGTVEHSGTPYMTLEVGDATRLTQELLPLGIKVRDCTSYGFPRCIRVSTRGAEADKALGAALSTIMRGAVAAAPPKRGGR